MVGFSMSRSQKFSVVLTSEERSTLQALIKNGRVTASLNARARVLLLMDTSPEGPAMTDQKISGVLSLSTRTMLRVRERFSTERLRAIEQHSPTHYRPRKLEGDAQARLVMIACSEPPEGHARWTLRLLADRLVALEIADVSYEMVRRALKKTTSNRG